MNEKKNLLKFNCRLHGQYCFSLMNVYIHDDVDVYIYDDVDIRLNGCM